MTYRKAEIRPYEQADEPLLFGLASLDRGADETTLGVLERETVFVAEVGGAPAGYVALEQGEQAVRVDQLFVSPEHEAEGVGRQLLQVVVESDDDRALAFYRGRGFKPVADDLLELLLPQRESS